VHHHGHLYLDRLPGITAGVATTLAGHTAMHLARYRGKLHLHGLTRLTDQVAEAFGRLEGYLCLQKVKRLSVRQAELLATHRGPLHLHALTIDDVTAEELGKHVGSLAVNVSEDARPIQIALIACHRGPLQIGGFKTIDQARARVLAARRSPDGIRGLAGLFISDVATITPDVAAILAGHAGASLSLRGLTEASPTALAALRANPAIFLPKRRAN